MENDIVGIIIKIYNNKGVILGTDGNDYIFSKLDFLHDIKLESKKR